MDFVVPSNFAKNALYYALQFGHYHCDDQYCIQRDSLDQFLFVYVRGGQFWVKTRGKTFVAEQDQVLLLDCHFAHKYYCKSDSEFLWFHFNGSSSLLYSEYLYELSGLVHTEKARVFPPPYFAPDSDIWI